MYIKTSRLAYPIDKPLKASYTIGMRIENTDVSILELISKKALFSAATENMAEPCDVVEMGNKLTETYDATIKESTLTPREKWNALVRGILEGGYLAAFSGAGIVAMSQILESPILRSDFEHLGLGLIAVVVPYVAGVTGCANVVGHQKRKTDKAVQTATRNEKKALWELIPVNGRVKLTREAIGRKLT